jgi:hypothetical protein
VAGAAARARRSPAAGNFQSDRCPLVLSSRAAFAGTSSALSLAAHPLGGPLATFPAAPDGVQHVRTPIMAEVDGTVPEAVQEAAGTAKEGGNRMAEGGEEAQGWKTEKAQEAGNPLDEAAQETEKVAKEQGGCGVDKSDCGV